MDHLSPFTLAFNPLFAAYLERKCGELPTDLALFTTIGESLRQFGATGKRLRPFVAFCAAGIAPDALGDHPILQLLFAIELYHLFALIHDDIMDRSDVRHGMPTMHARFGTDQAILIGDLCLSWAHECATAASDDSYADSIFCAMSEETIIGQMFDIALAKSIEPTEALLDRSVELKTVRYTFIYPLFLGRTFDTGAVTSDIGPMVRFGRALGHAFQRLDDLADIVWGAARLGKEPCADFQNGVPTHLWFHLQQYGSATERGTCSMLFGNREASPGAIRELIIDSGAYARERRMIEALLFDARAALETMSDAARWEPLVAMLEEKLAAL